MNTPKKSGIKAIVGIAAAVAILLGGLGITSAAAQSSIPGDALYSVKTSLEQTRLALANNAGTRAQLKMGFAEQRLTEISELITEGRNMEISTAVLAFEAEINGAILELDTLAQTDPARAAVLAKEITSALTRYAQTLATLAAAAPSSVRDAVSRALDTTQIAGNLDLPSDDNSSGNANSNDDNSNDNVNSNDDNGNDDNGNDDNGIDDNGNGNSNDDSGFDDNSNGNANSNDDSGNTNDDSGNTNDDSGNTNDNSGNTNDDSGGNSNDDSGGNSNDDSGGRGKDDNNNG